MAEKSVNKQSRNMTIRYRGRTAQVPIYLGKLLRMFVYQSDWKVLPMAALIAGLVGMVVRRRFFINMEGSIMGSFAMVMVAIWNGCFNSIQVICRERDVIKREHRSGMHISSYIFSHMVYQALLCAAQTVVTLYVTNLVGVKYPAEGLVTPVFLIDFGISMFLITFASDMLSLWVSTLAHSTTAAMTIMPFVLIFQLVFSGGMLTLPPWTQPLTNFTISNPGLKVIATQADTNHRPYATIADMVTKMRDSEISASITVGQVLDLLSDTGNPVVADFRATEVGGVTTLGEIRAAMEGSPSFGDITQTQVLDRVTVEDLIRLILTSEDLKEVRDYDFDLPGVTLGKLLEDASTAEDFRPILEEEVTKLTTVGDVLEGLDASGFMEKYGDMELGGITTVGELIDLMADDEDIQAMRGEQITLSITMGDLLDIIGEGNVRSFLEQKAAEASYNASYDHTLDNVIFYWLHLILFIIAFAALATITLEFIDKDKR